jgi:hypothetical protein
MTSPLPKTRTDGHDAGDWRVEREGLGAQIREADAPQQVLDFPGRAAGRACRGPGTPGLGHDGDAPAGCETLAQFGQPLARRGPEAEGVDREDDVEGPAEGGRKPIDRGVDQRDPPGPMAAALRLDACRTITAE